MFKGHKSLRSIIIASLLLVATAVTATASWTDYLNPFSVFSSLTEGNNKVQTTEVMGDGILSDELLVGETAFQDFGVGSGSNTTQTGSTILIPAPTGSGVGSATTYARGGATAPNAPVLIENTTNPLGSTGSFLRAVASTSTSVTKVSPYVAFTGSAEYYTSFKAMFGTSTGAPTATSGSWTYFHGTGAGFSDNTQIANAQVFGAIRFTYASGGTAALAYMNGSGAFVTTSLTATSFAQGVPHTIEMVGNNKASGTINYTYNGFSRSVAVQRMDLYINGILVGDDITVGGASTLSSGSSITSATLQGISSTSNVANIFLDDVATFSTVPAAISTNKISTFPYAETFEANNGGYFPWVTTGTANNWILGTPAKTQITGAHGGTKAWVTAATGSYSSSHNVAVSSPVFDLTGKPDPTLSFWSNFKTELDWDAMVLEMSINGGSTWTKVDANLGTGGTFNTANSTGWYNNNSTDGSQVAPPKWSGTSTAYTGHSSGWIQSTTVLTGAGGQSDVRLRWRFGSDSTGVDEGVAIDDISITVPSGPGTVQFSATSYTDLEGNTKTITVNRTGGSSGAISVDYATGGGTATGGAACTAGVDYVSASGTLNWADTDTAAKTINVQLCVDTDVETEALNLTLSNAVGTSITGTNPVPLNITDNPPGTVQFSSTTYASDEGLTAVITATRTGGTGGAVSVNYATSDGSATAGTCGSGGDYVSSSGTLNWANGDSASKSFNVTLCTDLLTSEGAETVNLTLSSPTGGATIGANNPAVLTINDAGITFCNTNPIAIADGVSNTSTINVSSLSGTINTVKVKLNNLSHTYGSDIDLLLVGPNGEKYIILSDALGTSGTTNASMTLSDSAAALVPTSPLSTGSYSYKPTNYTSGDTFAAPAPVGPYQEAASAGSATFASVFGGANPNGNWSVYVYDDGSGDTGSIAGGWCLEFTLTPPSPGTVQLSPSSYTPNENSVQTITATRTGGVAGAVSVDYATGGGTATAGTCGTDDYVSANGTLNWADGEGGAKTFNVTICPDAVSDPGETIDITLSNATGGVTIGGTNPGLITITDVPPPLSGTYTVGSGGNYPSLTNTGGIFEALNQSGVSGQVFINIISDLSGETGTNQLNDVTAGNNLTIRPSGGPWTITGSSAGSLIVLNGADNVVIDGSGTDANAGPIVGGDATLRKLTITNTNTGTASAVVSIHTGTNGATNNVIKNINVIGSGSTGGTLVGIEITGNTVGTVGADNDNNRITNCSVKKALYGIAALGASAANPNSQNYFNRNDLSATGADSIGRIGFYVLNIDGLEVQENSVGGISNALSSDSIGLGIGTQAVTTSSSTSGNITNGTISRNRINGVVNTNTYSAIGIAAACTSCTLVNNMVTGVVSDGTSGDFTAGIFVVSGTGTSTNVFHNSVAMTGDRGSSAEYPSYAMAITGTDTPVAMVNNAFYTSQVATGALSSAKSYAIGIVANNINFLAEGNAYWSVGANDGGFRTGSLTTTGNTDLATLAAWQAAISDDAIAQEVDPQFADPTNDLHLINPATNTLLNAGFNNQSPSVDFDNDPRPTTAPPQTNLPHADIGADEVVQAEGGVIPAGTFYNAYFNGGDTLAGNVTVTNKLYLNGINVLGANVLTLGCNASVSGAGATSFIDGAVKKDFCATGAFEFPVGQNQYSKVGVTITALGTNPSSLTVTPWDATLGGFPPATSLSRNWNLEETGDLTADLLFYYDDADVNGTESDYRAYKRAGNGVVSDMCGGPCVDTVNNVLGPIVGVSTFSRWTGAGPLAPTAADVSLSGRVTTADGRGVTNAVIVLTGNSLPQPMMVKTGSFGYYRFENLEAGETYVVTVNSKRFIFSVPSRVVSVPDNVSNIDFVAMSE